MSDLSELLGDKRPDGVSNRQIAARTGLAAGTVDKVMNGTHGIIEEPTLHALSGFFAIPVEVLREALGVPTGESQPWTPPPEADRLSRRQREAMDELIRSIVSGRRSESVDHSEKWPFRKGDGGATGAARPAP